MYFFSKVMSKVKITAVRRTDSGPATPYVTMHGVFRFYTILVTLQDETS